MTLRLDLPPDVEGAISEAARQQGTTPESLALDGLRGLFVATAPSEKRIQHPYDPAAAIAALDSFGQGDAEEQRQTLEYLKTAIDRDRPGQRSIFGQGINPMPSADETA